MVQDVLYQKVNQLPFELQHEVSDFVEFLLRKYHTPQHSNRREKILSFAGAFNEMDEDDYSEFMDDMKQTRENTFNRNIPL
jgi:hypothetical protein